MNGRPDGRPAMGCGVLALVIIAVWIALVTAVVIVSHDAGAL